MKSTFTAALLLLCSIAGMAQSAITSYAPGVSTEGAAYFLPKTAINISITTEKTTYIPGELCQYGERYLRIKNISDREDSYYTIKSVTLSTEGLPDESKLYYILFANNTLAPLVSLTDDGILQGINIAPAVEQPAAVAATPATPAERVYEPRMYMTEEMLMTSSKAKLAELVAKEIYNIRESKNLIIRGQNEHMPKDAESLRIILAGLEEQEVALSQLFVGTTAVETSTQTYQVIPEGDADRLVLGRFSRKMGLLHCDDLAGAPIYIDIKNKQVVPAPAVEPIVESASAKKSKKAQEASKQDGLVYNIPGKAVVKVYTNANTYVNETLTFGQFGNTETLSSTLLIKKKDIKITLDPLTGALLQVVE